MALVLQGGGALGAYQAGAYEALTHGGYVPEWIAGTSQAWELAYKDVDFSRTAIEERWQLGYRDASQALEERPWLRPVDSRTGLVVHSFPANPETYER